MAHGGDLPNELVFRILARLPVKSLLRFTVVCRLWCYVILYDRNFARAQLQAAREHPSQRHRRLLVSAAVDYESEDPQIQSFHLEKETETASFEVRELNFPNSEQLALLGSCNGLVFVTPFCGGEWVCVWNPSIYYACKKLPDPKFDMVKHGGDDVDWNVFFGAGHVAATDDYKVLVAHSSASYEYENEEDDDDEDCLVVEVKMFSMKLKAWKTIKPPKSTISCEKTPATVVRERLHWLDIDDNADEMVAFDLEKEEFDALPLPNFSEEMDGHVKVSHLGILAGGYLCVVRFPNLSTKEQQAANCDSFIDFWVMTEYGVARSWKKLYRFNYWSPGWCDEMLVTETCTVASLHKDDEEDTRLIRIDHKDKQEQQFGLYTTLEEGVDSMLEYEESLITLNGI